MVQITYTENIQYLYLQFWTLHLVECIEHRCEQFRHFFYYLIKQDINTYGSNVSLGINKTFIRERE